jgi:hypothetical protein
MPNRQIRRHDRSTPTQMSLAFEDARLRPPTAPPTPEVMKTLAELLLAAMAELRDGEVGHESEDRS